MWTTSRLLERGRGAQAVKGDQHSGKLAPLGRSNRRGVRGLRSEASASRDGPGKGPLDAGPHSPEATLSRQPPGATAQPPSTGEPVNPLWCVSAAPRSETGSKETRLVTHGATRLPWSLEPGSTDLGSRELSRRRCVSAPCPWQPHRHGTLRALSSVTHLCASSRVNRSQRGALASEPPWRPHAPWCRRGCGEAGVAGRQVSRAEIPALAWNCPLAAPALPRSTHEPGRVSLRRHRLCCSPWVVCAGGGVRAGRSPACRSRRRGRTSRESTGTRQGCRSNSRCCGGVRGSWA